VAVSGQSAFVGCDDGYTYELDQIDGKILRRFHTGTQVTTEPLIWNSRLYVGEGVHTTHHARIYSFDLRTGQMLGTFQTLGHTEGNPILATSHGISSLFAMAGKDGIYSLDPDSLEQRWHQVLGHTDSEVRVEGDRVFFATGVEKGEPASSHRAYALDFSTGKVLWSAELAASGWMAPVIIGREVCFGVGEIYSESKFGALTCFDQSTGEMTHTINTKSPVLGVPFLLGQTVMTSNLDGEVCAFGWPSGNRLWCHKTEGKTFASVTYEDHGNFFYPSAKEGLLLLDATRGSLKAKWMPTADQGKWAKSYSRVTRGADGWYLSDSVGNIRKFSVEVLRAKDY
jgi:outer membrane protein assembly factor BamB